MNHTGRGDEPLITYICSMGWGARGEAENTIYFLALDVSEIQTIENYTSTTKGRIFMLFFATQPLKIDPKIETLEKSWNHNTKGRLVT